MNKYLKLNRRIKEWFYRTWVRKLYLYLKYRKEINELYNFSLKGKYGEQVGEDWNWLERLEYWLHSI